MTLLMHPAAGAELDGAIDWTAEHRSPGKAVELSDALTETMDTILSHPHGFAKADDGPIGDDVRNVILTRFPYRVGYIVLTGGLYIIAAAHTSMRPAYWASRIENG